LSDPLVAIASPTDLPFPRELEVPERIAGHEIAAGGGLAVRQSGDLAVGELPDCAVLDLPVGGGNGVVAQSAPAVESFAVEEETPSGAPLVIR